MARQETFGDRLSDQGCYAKTRGEAFVIDIKAYLPETYLKTSPRPRARRMALIFATCLMVAPLVSTPSHAAAKIQHLVSPGGIEAWFVQDATVPLIAMEYAFGGGATQDSADKPGVGNLVADLLRMSLTSPHFESTDVERIRSQVLSGLRRDTSNPTALATRKFLEITFGDHPYARQANGTLESVPKIDVADLKDYVRRVLAKDTLRIAVVGDVDPAALGKLLDQTFGGLPAKASLTPVADVEAAKPPERAFIPLDVPQTVVTFGGPGIKRNDPAFMAGYVVNHILGGGGS